MNTEHLDSITTEQLLNLVTEKLNQFQAYIEGRPQEEKKAAVMNELMQLTEALKKRLPKDSVDPNT